MAFNLCGLGGTFDHLHDGHKMLLSTAFKLAKKVAIGLATDELLKNKAYSEVLQPFETRKNNILKYIASINPKYVENCLIIPLKDPFGPAITNPDIEIHVSSEETIKVAMKINQIREERGLNKMILVMVPTVKNEKGTKLSSTDLRKKEMES